MPPPISNRWTTDPEYIDLLNFLIERTENVTAPMSMHQLARDFKEKSGAAQTESCLQQRIERVRTKIHSFAHIHTNNKVKMLFALSASVDSNFLKNLKKNAFVEVNDKKQITHYKANDENLELKGDHSPSAKQSTAQLASKQSVRSLIDCYFEKKSDTVPNNKEGKEMKALIEFTTEKCENANSPLSIRQLTINFNKSFGISRSVRCIHKRIRAYCNKIQKTELLDTHSEVKLLFGLSMKLDSDYLEKLRKNAVVEVDDLNRITKYTANDGRLILHGDHSMSAKLKLEWTEKKKKRNAVKKCEESENGKKHPEDDSDEYSSEEFDSEFDSEEENDPLDETEDLMELSKETNGFENDTPVKNRSSTKMSIDDNLNFDPSTERFHGSDEIEIGEENHPEITENAQITTRSGRLSKRRHLDSNFSYDLENSSSSGAVMSSSSSYSKPAKQQKIAFQKGQISRSSEGLMESSIDNHGVILIETPIKAENSTEDVKSKTTHNSKLKFFEAMESLILFLDAPSLSWIQSKIHQKIRKLKKSGEMISNEELIPALELLIARMANHSVVNLSERVESVSLIQFFCYLKATILNSKMIGVEGVVENIRKRIEESQDKKIEVEEVAIALRVTLDIDGF